MLPEDYEKGLIQLEEGFEFDRRVTVNRSLVNAFYIFTKGEVCNELPNLRLSAQSSNIIQAATDGSCINNGTAEARAGAGIFTEGEDGLEIALRILATLQQSNQVGEAVATKELADRVNTRAMLHNATDSTYVLRHLTTSLQVMEDTGYVEVPNREILQAMVASFCRRKQVSTIKWVKGHNGHYRNVMANILVDKGAQKETEDPINLNIEPSLCVTGAALPKLTQSRAYKALQEHCSQNLPLHKKTTNNVKLAMQGAQESFGFKPSESALGRSLRHKDIVRPRS
ncbi:hypothetical protein ARMGADRAFT_948936 [Armillaria gallica]|uniref:RNase H type-1 domain-containing protein n=1 Tax=Armillaria gallica TaxID=47427 RepID=A0A2H3CGD5_ARMGA|nr:hypothetical protein ARMGADRAFT_948936 [Armillaria gallica]